MYPWRRWRMQNPYIPLIFVDNHSYHQPIAPRLFLYIRTIIAAARCDGRFFGAFTQTMLIIKTPTKGWVSKRISHF